MVNINEYDEVKECDYKGEHYSVRDNGAIMRHQREGKKKRPNDEVWSWGTSNAKGYLCFCNERVHRIVATAFHGEAPSEEHVVDHIDTNRSNNRPENLRWLTRLENTLKNEFTRKKVEMICGSVEAFLKDPSLLYGHEFEDSNFSWMRTVTKEEAKNCLDNWNNWLKSEVTNTQGGKLGEWIFEKKERPTKNIQRSNHFSGLRRSNFIEENVSINNEKIEEQIDKDSWYKSITPSAMQSWYTKTEFPCCPLKVAEDGLEHYKNNLKEGSVFSKNTHSTYYVMDSCFDVDGETLVVLSTTNEGEVFGAYSLATIKIENDKFCHTNLKRFGNKEDALHFYKLHIGEVEWTEEDFNMWDT